MRWTGFWIGGAIFVALAYAYTFVVDTTFPLFVGYVMLQFIVLATAWNILGGYAGYVNFGTSAFFGVGVYTAFALFKAFALPLPLQIAAAALVGAGLGVGTGLMTMRLRGIFYSIATVALVIILETIVVNWKFVGGAAGAQIVRPPLPSLFPTYEGMLFVVAAIMVVIAVATARYIEGSWIGRGLRAIRDDELAAECSGVPTLKLKLIACGISGALMCAMGAPNPMYQQFAIPSAAFELPYSVSPLAMALIGGTAHWIGPVLGGLLLSATQQYVSMKFSNEFGLLALGVMLVLFVVAAPEGIIGLLRKIGLFKAGSVRPSGDKGSIT